MKNTPEQTFVRGDAENGTFPESFCKTESLRIFLSARSSRIEREASTAHYDFAGRRVAKEHFAGDNIEPSAGSLYARLAYAWGRLRNRHYVGHVSGDEDSPDPMFDLFSQEAIFGMSYGEPPVLDLTRSGSEIEVRVGARMVARITTGTEPIPESLRASFRGAVVHSGWIHPALAREIADLPHFPRLVVTSLYDVHEVREVTWSIDAVEIAAMPAPPAAMPVALTNEPSATASLVRSIRLPLDAEALRQRLSAKMAGAAGKPFDAFLAAQELLFSFDSWDEAKPFLDIDEAGSKTDPRMRAFRKTRHRDPAETAAALAKFDRKGLADGAIIDILLANAVENSGDLPGAMRLYRSVLAERPWITGVWHDLGFAHWHDGDPDTAWVCWDFARAALPPHPMLDDVADTERKMREGDPFFFGD